MMIKKNDLSTQINRILKEVKSLPSGPESLKKLKFLREEYDMAIKGYRNSLNILSDTTYEDRKHFLLELIQNADDASFKNKRPEITFTILEDAIELTYNEKGFDVEDVISITDTGASTKAAKKSNSNSFIGEKGIGFKSVFALASEVEIESYPWHFKLLKDKCIVPEIVDGGTLEEGEGTRIKVKFIEISSVDIIAQELDRFVSGEVESFLFLQKLSCFNVIDLRNNESIKKSLILEPQNRRATNITLRTLPEDKMRKYSLYEEKLVFSKELVAMRWEKIGTSIGDINRSVTVAALVDCDDKDLPAGRLFCFLPTEVSLPIPIFLQVDGHTKADREKLHDIKNNEWNKHLIISLPQILLRAILKWRENKSLAKNLPNFIPINTGTDQLHNVFNELKELLIEEEWVRTCDKEFQWVKPKDAIIMDEFFMNWFKKYPEFRVQAEMVLKKKFIDFNWTTNNKWMRIFSAYSIEKMNIDDVISILKECDIPEEMLKEDKNAIRVYKYINSMINASESSKSRYSQKNKKYSLCYAKIFPIEGVEGFISLKNNPDDKIFWVSSNSKRATGIESSIDFNVINSEYTYTAKASSDSISQTVSKVKIINERNEALKWLLRYLEIPELTDESLLSELQLPWMLEKSCSNHKELLSKFKVLMAVYNSYKMKKNYDEDYLSKLSELGDSEFMGEDEKAYKLNNLLLPGKFKIETIDYLYDVCDLETLKIPPSVLKIVGKKEEFRKFLIHCGIKHKPNFITSAIKYYTVGDFKHKCSVRHKAFEDRVGYDYTYNNSIEVKRVELDDATKKIFNSEEGKFNELEQYIYSAWKTQFSEIETDINTIYYKYDVIPGYYLLKYLRFDDRKLLFRDDTWSGIKREDVPIKTVGDKVIRASQALRCIKFNDDNINNMLSKLNVVEENSEKGYKSEYLESLDIKTIKIADLNELWSIVNPTDYDTIVKLAVEVMKFYGEEQGLLIYDKVKKKLKSVNEFRLGDIAAHGVPLISKQYGDAGEKLGRLLNLREDRTMQAFRGIFNKVFCEEFEDDEVNQEKLYSLLKNWYKWNQSDKGKLAQQLEKKMQEMNCLRKPVIVFNDAEKVGFLKESGIIVVGLYIENLEQESYEIERAAKELGFTFEEECGRLILEDESILTDNEIQEFNYVIGQYLQLIEIGEASRFKTLLIPFGGAEAVYSRIVRVSSAVRMIDVKNDLSIGIDLPYFDNDEGRIIVDKFLNINNITINIITALQFTTLRSAKRDIDEISDKYIHFIKKSKNRVKAEAEVASSKENKNINEPIVKVVAKEIEESLIDIKVNKNISENIGWKLGLDPEEEQILRGNLINSIENTLNAGPEFFDKKVKKITNSKSKFKIPENKKIIDTNGINPKEFINAEYGGRCQLCGTMLSLHNGNSLINIYRMRERKNGQIWWADRPFNILGLCPNCHTLAKHGGRDFSNLYNSARELLKGDIFPEEVQEFNGDFYVVDVTVNKKVKKIKMSAMHMNYFAALIENSEGIKER